MKNRRQFLTLFLGIAVVLSAPPTTADPRRDAILADLRTQARAADPAFSGFSAERGAFLFTDKPGGGKPDTPSCTTCHGPTPRARGETRTGKPIEPMAVSLTPDRFTEQKKVAKWFRRNCNNVLGRACTAREKGDFIAYMMTQ